jgi:dynein assembly factor 3, axonemal
MCTDINMTMASGVICEQNYRSGQYLGDQLTGPFISFGVESDDAEMLKKCNNKFVRSATDISEYNVTKLMFELAYKKAFEGEDFFLDDWAGVNVTPVLSRMNSARSLSREDSGYFRSPAREEYCSLIVDDIEIVFLSPGTLDDDKPSSKFRGTFHVIIIGHALVPQIIGQNLLSLATDEALLLIEGKKYVVGPRRCELKEFKETFVELMKDLGMEPLPFNTEYDPSTDDIVRYLFQRRVFL